MQEGEGVQPLRLLRRRSLTKNVPVRVGFCELQDPRLEKTCDVLLGQTKLSIGLVGRKESFTALSPELKSSSRVELISVAEHADQTRETIVSFAANRGKSYAEADLASMVQNPLYCLGALLTQGKLDAAVAGFVETTANVIRAGLRTVGLGADHRMISSSFLFCPPEGPADKWILFADCGVNPKPSKEQFAQIARQTAQKWKALFGSMPNKIAFLSYATGGSASGEQVDLVKEAAQCTADFLAREGSDFAKTTVVGPIQFDAAFVPAIGRAKGVEFDSDTPSEVYVFPDLNSANIAYKVANHMGGYHAYGPLLQGLAKPFTDCSRGASVEEIAGSAVISAIEASHRYEGL